MGVKSSLSQVEPLARLTSAVNPRKTDTTQPAERSQGSGTGASPITPPIATMTQAEPSNRTA